MVVVALSFSHQRALSPGAGCRAETATGGYEERGLLPVKQRTHNDQQASLRWGEQSYMRLHFGTNCNGIMSMVGTAQL